MYLCFYIYYVVFIYGFQNIHSILQEIKKVVKENPTKGIYRVFSKDSLLYHIRELDWKGRMYDTLHMDMDLKDDKIPLIDLPLLKV